MAYTNVAKPTGANYTNVAKPTGTGYINVAKPAGIGLISKGMATGLICPPTYSTKYIIVAGQYTNISKPT